jgi:hypothetical protein
VFLKSAASVALSSISTQTGATPALTWDTFPLAASRARHTGKYNRFTGIEADSCDRAGYACSGEVYPLSEDALSLCMLGEGFLRASGEDIV